MTLRFYSFTELLAAGKAVARGIAGIGTEAGKDIELTLFAAAKLFQGVQVGVVHVDEQLDPATADAQRRDAWIDELGLTFEKDATYARGLIVAGPNSKAGDIVTFPGELHPDGVERSYRLLQDVTLTIVSDVDADLNDGSGVHKIFPKRPDGVKDLFARAMIAMTNGGSTAAIAAVKTASLDDQSIEFYAPMQAVVGPTSQLSSFNNGAVVEAECTEPGEIGNATRIASSPFGGFMIVEMGGGGEAVGPVDSDTARVVAMIEDTIACPPSAANLQHLRELVLKCPDVDVDDAVVYQHARGPTTIDIVAIGRSGSVRSASFPDANLSFFFGGNNQRVIGDVQAKRIEAWLKAQLSYRDDLRVRSVEWDWRGNGYADTSMQAFVQASGGVFVSITPLAGYGPDSGIYFDTENSTPHATRLHGSSMGASLPIQLQPGHRIWALVAPSSNLQHAFATVVAPVLSISSDRTYATIADVSQLAPGLQALYGGVLKVYRWGVAGPLTQPILDAAFKYFDQLGPGSYTEPPRGPNYVRYFHSEAWPAQPGSAVTRWPPEGRRWNSPVRESELRADLMAIEGVDDVRILAQNGQNGPIDYEPSLFRTLALRGVIPHYGP